MLIQIDDLKGSAASTAFLDPIETEMFHFNLHVNVSNCINMVERN